MAAAAIAIGALAGVAGAINQGESGKAAGDYNAAVAENNARQAEAEAAENERRARIDARKQAGAARAAIGASGVSIEGSPEDILGESAANAELDALTIRHQGQAKAAAFRTTGRLQRFYGEQARTQGYLGAAGAGAGGASKFIK